jgi:hypothetical protein
LITKILILIEMEEFAKPSIEEHTKIIPHYVLDNRFVLGHPVDTPKDNMTLGISREVLAIDLNIKDQDEQSTLILDIPSSLKFTF